jgi:hypothetical protein
MPWGCHELLVTNKKNKTMTKTNSNGMSNSDWNIPFWFALLSPVLGVVMGFLALLVIYR